MKKSYLLLTLLFAAYIAISWPRSTGKLIISMLDVGQGDAIHIRTPLGKDILIDGGPDRAVLQELGETMPPTDHTLEYVIVTHPDADHVAGLADVPDIYSIQTLITNGVPKETAFAEAVDALHPQHVRRGQTLQIEEGLTLEFLHPDPNHLHGDAYNNDSITFILHYRDFTALFTGDIEMEVEKELASLYGRALNVDLLKAAHHGSKTSSTQELLDVTQPTTVLMSLGQDNKFGHPHDGPMYRLQQTGATIYRTDQQGRITCRTGGADVACTTER